MILYRYFNLDHGLEALQTRRWKIGRIAELNDPSDCRPTFVNVPPEVHAIPEVLDFFSQSVAHLAGVLCFSAVISDPVIWSHYADAHRGLALGFDFGEDKDFFPISYSNKRAKVDFTELLKMRMGESKDVAKEMFSVKAKSWEYEREHRCLIDLDACSMVGKHYFRPLPCKNLKEVVLGAKSPLAMHDIARTVHPKERIDPACSYPEKVVIRQCKMNDVTYDLDCVDF